MGDLAYNSFPCTCLFCQECFSHLKRNTPCPSCKMILKEFAVNPSVSKAMHAIYRDEKIGKAPDVLPNKSLQMEIDNKAVHNMKYAEVLRENERMRSDMEALLSKNAQLEGEVENKTLLTSIQNDFLHKKVDEKMKLRKELDTQSVKQAKTQPRASPQSRPLFPDPIVKRGSVQSARSPASHTR